MLRILVYIYIYYILAVYQYSSLLNLAWALNSMNTSLIVAQGTYGRIPFGSLARRVVAVFPTPAYNEDISIATVMHY